MLFDSSPDEQKRYQFSALTTESLKSDLQLAFTVNSQPYFWQSCVIATCWTPVQECLFSAFLNACLLCTKLKWHSNPALKDTCLDKTGTVLQPPEIRLKNLNRICSYLFLKVVWKTFKPKPSEHWLGWGFFSKSLQWAINFIMIIYAKTSWGCHVFREAPSSVEQTPKSHRKSDLRNRTLWIWTAVFLISLQK